MPAHAKLDMIVVNIKRDTPKTGMAQLVTKLHGLEKDKIDQAAFHLGLTQSEFLRTVLVSAAEYTMTQLGKTVTETGKFVSLKEDNGQGENDNGTV